MPPKSKKEEPVRRGSRNRHPPQRYRPNEELPIELANLVHQVTVGAAQNSSMPLSPQVLNELESALSTVLVNMLVIALIKAETENRDTISIEDLEAVKDQFLSKPDEKKKTKKEEKSKK